MSSVLTFCKVDPYFLQIERLKVEGWYSRLKTQVAYLFRCVEHIS
jgi:hypothetical protein